MLLLLLSSSPSSFLAHVWLLWVVVRLVDVLLLVSRCSMSGCTPVFPSERLSSNLQGLLRGFGFGLRAWRNTCPTSVAAGNGCVR
jgi:hypothetical protein